MLNKIRKMFEKMMKKMSWRIIRRFGVVFVLGGISGLILELSKYQSSDVETIIIITFATAGLVALDKAIREYQGKSTK